MSAAKKKRKTPPAFILVSWCPACGKVGIALDACTGSADTIAAIGCELCAPYPRRPMRKALLYEFCPKPKARGRRWPAGAP